MEMVRFIIIFILFSHSAYADRISDLIPANARALGMGNTGINSLDDSYAIFYNPANLAAKRIKTRLELVNLQTDVNVGAVNGFSSQKKTPLDLGSIYPYLKSNPGQFSGYRFSVYPNFTSRIFSFGLLYENSNNAKFDEAKASEGTQDRVTQYGLKRVRPTAGVSFRSFGGLLKFGYSLGVEYLSVVDSVVTSPDDKPLSWTNGVHEGVGIIHTVGFTGTLPFAHLPSFSLVGRNIGQTKYFGGDVNRTDKMSLDASLSYTTRMDRWYEMKLSVDVRDTINQMKANFMRRFFSGVEFTFFRGVNLRAGWSQGYPSAGVGFGSKSTRLDFAWYSLEAADRYRAHRDERFVLQITIGFFNTLK